MNDTEKMQQAAELIKAKQYDQARALLRSVNHPQATRWLAKLDQVSSVPPEKKASPEQRVTPKKKAEPRQKAKREKSASSGGGCLRRVLIFLVLLLVVVSAIGAAFIFLNSGGEEEEAVVTTEEPTEAPATEVPTIEAEPTDSPTATPEATEEATATPFPTAEPTQAPEIAENRVQILDSFSPAADQRLITVELPGDWQLAPEDSFGATLKKGDDYEGTAVSVARVTVPVAGVELKTLAETNLGAGVELLDLKSTTVQGRTIWIRSTDTPAGRIDTFYVQDSDGDIAFLSTLPTVLNHDELQSDIAFIASTLEIE